jgi:hypothetical protein
MSPEWRKQGIHQAFCRETSREVSTRKTQKKLGEELHDGSYRDKIEDQMWMELAQDRIQRRSPVRAATNLM